MNRKNIGLMFTSGKHWIGGVIYIQNLIRSINKLDDNQKPNLFIFYNDLAEPYIKEIDYPYITLEKIIEPSLILGYFLSIITRKNKFEQDFINKYNLDGLFPFDHYPVKVKKNNYKTVAWYPDLQHRYYPEYFSKFNLFTRDLRAKLVLKKSENLVLSSNNVFFHFRENYTIPPKLNIHILQFTSIIDKSKLTDYSTVKKKYKLPERYFIVSNQFWKHKNHITVFKAISELKELGEDVKVVFTGNMEDNRNISYNQELSRFVNDKQIHNNCIFVGLVNRLDQLSMMQNSLAVIQPSLFEGWSTVNEDAKALGVQIIAADLEVNLEQLENGEKGHIFPAMDSHSLANIMRGFLDDSIEKKPIFEDYEWNIKMFATQFLNIF